MPFHSINEYNECCTNSGVPVIDFEDVSFSFSTRATLMRKARDVTQLSLTLASTPAMTESSWFALKENNTIVSYD